MKFFGSMIGWLAASVVAYVLSTTAAQTLIFNELAELAAIGGAKLEFSERLPPIWDSLTSTLPLLGVIAVGMVVAFFVASLVKAVVPPLSAIAYPVAGGAAMATVVIAISRFSAAYDGLPGTEGALGLGLQIAAGVVAGIVFEIYRPR